MREASVMNRPFRAEHRALCGPAGVARAARGTASPVRRAGIRPWRGDPGRRTGGVG